MKTLLGNLNNELKSLKLVSTFCEYYDYIKISTTCPINYSDEFLVLYAKIIDDGVLITDLNSIYEDATMNGISKDILKEVVENEGLNFDGISVFAQISVNDIGVIINSFFNVIRKLDI